MATESDMREEKPRKRRMTRQAPGSDAVYGLGVLGAWFYYLSHAASFWLGALGILKGIFWPAFLVYELLKYLKM